MRIVIKAPEAYLPGPHQPGTIGPLLPSWADVEVYDDHGNPITDVVEISLHITPTNEPITAVVTHLVTEVDITCEGDVQPSLPFAPSRYERLLEDPS